MDLVYMSDALSYHSIRAPIYDRYDYRHNYTTYKDNGMEKKNQVLENDRGGKCRICREKQKRKLSAYIRSKSVNSNCEENKIIEEEEESQGGCVDH